MKELEKEYRTYLPKKSYAVLRVDGKGFSKYTKGLEKPFDQKFTIDMQDTAKYLAENIDGALFAYTQSDEISVVFSDLSGENTEWWLGGQVQKLVSITAALATAKFNSARNDGKLAVFDARVHHLDGEEGVLAYVQWRQEDAMKNSVGMMASHHFSHRQLEGVSTTERINMLFRLGVNWCVLPTAFRQGSLVRRVLRDKSTTFVQGGVEKTIEFQRREWEIMGAPEFTTTEWLGLK